MNKYVRNGKTYWAWSEMECKSQEQHGPHSHNPEFTVFGPYFCEGWPLYVPKHRGEYTGE